MEIFCSIIRANPLIVAFHSAATAGCYEMSFQLCLKKPIMHIPLAAIKVCVLEGIINFHTKIVKYKLSFDFFTQQDDISCFCHIKMYITMYKYTLPILIKVFDYDGIIVVV